MDRRPRGPRPTELLEGRVCVPPHFDAEVVGALRALVQRDVLHPAGAERAIDRHLRAPFDREFDPADVQAAWRIRESLSFADAWYAVLARRLGTSWLTADAQAASTARGLGVEVAVL